MCATPLIDIELLAGIAVFNLLAGNCDAHGKNFSLLHRENGIGLAPFYDLVSTTVWPELDTRLSMRFGKEYNLEKINPSDFDFFAGDLGIKKSVVVEWFDIFKDKAPAAWASVASFSELKPYGELLERMHKAWEKRFARVAP